MTSDLETDVALARSVVYRALAFGFQFPTESRVARLAAGRLALEAAAALLDSRRVAAEPLLSVVRVFADLAQVNGAYLAAVHVRLFGHSEGLVCPFETEYGAGGSFRQPQELLRKSCARLRQGAPDAELDVAVMAQDLALLLRDHIRKEDGVIHPLLERLLREGVRS